MMKFEITHQQNGILVQAEGEDGVVYQEKEGEEIEAFRDFLYFLIENYGPSDCQSRYSAKRLYVEIRPGDKFADVEDE